MSSIEPTDPGLFATLYSARALRRFKAKAIPEDALFQIMDAAIRAPSGQNAQDWRFILVRDAAHKAKMQTWAQEPWRRYRARYDALPGGVDALPRSQRLSLRSVEHLVHHLASVPAIIVVLGLKGRHSTPGGSAFPAVQNLLLAARGLGLSGSIFNLPLAGETEMRKLLAIPDNNQIYCLLPIGYPADKHGPLRRKPVKQVVYDGRFGATWRFAERQAETGWQDKWLPSASDAR